MTVVQERELAGLAALVAWLDERGVRYEVVDGTVVVSPPPSSAHEHLGLLLGAALLGACPPQLLVQPRYGWRYDPSRPGSYLEPDYAVVDRSGIEVSESLHDAVPLLVVETRSPGTWRLDEGVKRELYAAGGVASYWLLDPDGPRLRVLELVDGGYVEAAVVGPGESVTVVAPFPVTVTLPPSSRRRSASAPSSDA